MKSSNNPRLTALLFNIALLAGCVTVPPEAESVTWPAERYYTEARQAQADNNYSGALKSLAALKEHHPNSEHAKLVPYESAYAHYQLKEYLAAIQSADQYIAQQPGNDGLDYAWYIKGMAHLKLADQNSQTPPFDADNNRAAYQSFVQLAQRFPESRYRTEALQQLQPLRTRLADHELDTIHTLLQRGEQQGAHERAAYLIESYPDSSAATAARTILQSSDNSTVSQQNESWLLQQAPDHFTLQIAGTSNRERRDQLVAQAPEQIVWFQRTQQGRPWYTLLYGHYSSAAEAKAAMPALKSALRIEEAWVQPLSDIQEQLRSTAGD